MRYMLLLVEPYYRAEQRSGSGLGRGSIFVVGNNGRISNLILSLPLPDALPESEGGIL